MKKVLFLCGVITLLASAGCVVAPEHRRDRDVYRAPERHESRPEVVVPDPVIVVRPPEVIIR
jgi:hypothetical protein